MDALPTSNDIRPSPPHSTTTLRCSSVSQHSSGSTRMPESCLFFINSLSFYIFVFWFLLTMIVILLFFVNCFISFYSFLNNHCTFFHLNWETFFGHTTISVMNLGFTGGKGLVMTVTSKIPWLQANVFYFREIHICIQLPEVSLFQNAGSKLLNFSS